jgi:DNA excision repair protein ERCC-6
LFHFQHDVIVEGGEGVSDYMLIEAEAERVAKEAVQRLRMSRRQCFPAEAGVPTW